MIKTQNNDEKQGITKTLVVNKEERRTKRAAIRKPRRRQAT